MKTLLKTIIIFILLLIFSRGVVYAINCSGGVSGTIHDSTGAPIADVRVTLYVDGAPFPHPATSRTDGSFVFLSPIKGDITISAVKNGYLPITAALPSCQGYIFVMNSDNAPTPSPGREPRCGTTCATSTQCQLASDYCTLCYGQVCIDPERIPPPTPNATAFLPSVPPAIDFDKLKDAIPSLNPIFKGGASNVGSIISTILPYLFVIAGLLLLFYLIYGGFQMMIAANDEKGLVEAKGKITNALTGFVLLFLSYWLVKLIGFVLGISIL